jgi:hypothetical protein
MTTLGQSWTITHEHLVLHMLLRNVELRISRLATANPKTVPALRGMLSTKRQPMINADAVSLTLIAAPSVPTLARKRHPRAQRVTRIKSITPPKLRSLWQ